MTTNLTPLFAPEGGAGIGASRPNGKLGAAICPGAGSPIAAGVTRGVQVPGSRGIKDALANAGALWEAAPVAANRHFVSSRKPDDLPDFCRGILQVMESK